MKYLAALTVLAALASAAAVVDVKPKPRRTALMKRQAGVCAGIDQPLCCQLDVDGIVDLTCSSPGDVTSLEELEAECAKEGLSAECCTLSVDGDALLCTSE
ncbi:hypothetical protein K490DRAFT_65214 [Saccharata proteae CBS 121410]|uniref:Hydrophobin n=1 Tax=Saccharata proteae CBS 121410 TaxID=1314787 RepID=A0A9P4HXM8_9PEZI|nr:hypothetical protein K490DRAFT_65214 [Saccharata proteae CBS 121410]